MALGFRYQMPAKPTVADPFDESILKIPDIDRPRFKNLK